MTRGSALEFAGIRIANKLIDLARAVLDDDAVGTNVKVGRNTLQNSALQNDLEAKVRAVDDMVITLLFNHYVTYLEWDRPPEYGKWPPLDEIKEWAEKNGIETDASTLFLIRRAIWRDGHVGRPIFATLDKLIDDQFVNVWAPQVFDAIMEDIDNFFNNGL